MRGKNILKYYLWFFVVGYCWGQPILLLGQNELDPATGLDSTELVRLYEATQGTNWTKKWDLNKTMSQWHGVTLDASGRVTGLDLSQNNLSGSLPNLDLSAIKVLKLHSNILSGNLPLLDKMPSLDTLALHNNQFDGWLENYNLPSLIFLNLSNNQFKGGIPNFTQMPQLEVLGLDNNPLNTTIPNFTSIPNLKELYLFRCQLKGNIPNFTNLPHLEILQLGDNNLQGILPAFDNLSSLIKIDVWVNQLSGAIPYMYAASQLQRLDASNNQFTDLADYSQAPSLTELVVNNNYLTFEDLVPNVAIEKFTYSAQAKVGASKTISVSAGTSYTIALAIDQQVSGNQYKWYKASNDQLITTTYEPSLTLENLSPADAGTYYTLITNTSVPDITLQSQNITLDVTSAPADDPCAVAQFEHTAAGNQVTFYNQSFGGGTYSWDFGDGNTSTQSDPQHTYTDVGIYQVCLTVTDDCGSDTYCQEIQLYACDSIIPEYAWAVLLPQNAQAMALNEQEDIIVGGAGFFAKYNAAGNQIFNKNIPGADVADMAIDAEGNILLIGSFFETADLDPSGGQLMVSGDNGLFVAKYTPEGNLKWSFPLFGADIGFPTGVNGISSDLQGNIYITGTFANTFDIDPSDNEQILQSAGQTDLFWAKFDMNGVLIFGERIGGIDFDYGSDIEIKNETVFLGGEIESFDVDFDPSDEEKRFSGGGGTAAVPFIAQYTLNGEYKNLYFPYGNEGGPSILNSVGFISALKVDGKLDMYVGGAQTVPNGTGYMAFSKGDRNNLNTYFRIVFSSNPIGRDRSEVTSVDFDSKGFLYGAGWMGNEATFDSFEITNNAPFNYIFTKLSSTGTFDYAFSPEMEAEFGDSRGNAVEVNGKNDIYTLGDFRANSIDFDPSDNEALFSDNGTYLIKYTQVCAEQACTLEASVADIIHATCGQPNGSARIDITGAQGTPTIEWSNGTTSTTVENLLSGTYSVTITDEQGCEITRNFEVMDTDVPEAVVDETVDANCNQANGEATISVTGGLAPFVFQLSDGQGTAGTNTFNPEALAVGSYQVIVSDANECQDTATFTIEQSGQPTVEISDLVDATCNTADGAATITASEGTAPYSFELSDGQTITNLTTWEVDELAEGSYEVIVSDANECQDTATFTIEQSGQPTVEISDLVAASCNAADGAATIKASEGKAPYSFELSDGQTITDLTTWEVDELAEGSYEVIVSDANECQDTATFEIKGTNKPLLTTSDLKNSTCEQANGSITLTASKGIAPYTFDLNNELTETSPSKWELTNLIAGTYEVIVTDAKSCSDTATFALSTTTNPISQIDNLSEATCGEANGSATITVEQGSAPYQYRLKDEPGFTQDTDNILVLDDLKAGEYTVIIEDNNTCSVTASFEIEAAGMPILQINDTNAATCGEANGSAAITADGGIQPYSFDLSDGQSVTETNTFVPTGLADGSYQVFVTDANGCQDSATFEIATEDGPNIKVDKWDASCGQENGVASVSITGGVTPYEIMWSTNSTDSLIDNLQVGTYTVTVTDDNDCSVSRSIEILDIPAPIISAFAKDATCGEDNGTASVDVINAATDVTISWNNSQISNTIEKLKPSSYIVTVEDENNCTTSDTVEVMNIPGPSLLASITDATCGIENGGVSVTALAGTPPYTFDWDNGATIPLQENLAPGSYTVTVTDSNICSIDTTLSIGVSDGPVIELTTQPAICGEANGTASVDITGGNPTYEIEWSNGATNTTSLDSLAPGTYTISVTDSDDCRVSRTFTIAASDIPHISLLSIKNASCNRADGSATVAVSGGVGSYQILWSNGQQTPKAQNLAAGIYEVSVADDNGCADQLSVEIDEITTAPNVRFTTFISNLSVSFNNNTSEADSFFWDFGDGNTSSIKSPSHTYADTGIYEVCLTAFNDCDSNQICASVELFEFSSCNLVLNTSSTPADCDQSNGTATVQAFPQGSNYSYWWQTSPAQFTAKADSLPPGRYQVVVSRGNCRDTASTVINTTGTPPTADFDYTFNETDSVTISFVNQSTSAESYYWDFGNGYLAFTENPTYAYPTLGTYKVTLGVGNVCGSDTLVKEINLLNPVSTTPDFPQNTVHVHIYPNPNQGIFNLEVEADYVGQVWLSVFNLTGQTVFKQPFIKAQQRFTHHFNTHQISKGLYLLRIEMGDTIQHKKFEVNK